MITLFFHHWFTTIIGLCILVILGELWLAPIPGAIPATIAFMHAWFWLIVILSGFSAYKETSEAHEKMREEHMRSLREKQG